MEKGFGKKSRSLIYFICFLFFSILFLKSAFASDVPVGTLSDPLGGSGPVTLIRLISFTFEKVDKDIALKWKTGSEIDNAGFNIWKRANGETLFKKINNSLIGAQGDPLKGASYTFTDKKTESGKSYLYRLEDIDTSGKSTFHEATLRVSAAKDIAETAETSNVSKEESSEKPGGVCFISALQHQKKSALFRPLASACYLFLALFFLTGFLRRGGKTREKTLSTAGIKLLIALFLISPLFFLFSNTVFAVKNYNSSRSNTSLSAAPVETPVLNPDTKVLVPFSFGPHQVNVDTYNGNLYYRSELIQIPLTQGPPLSFSLNYNSMCRNCTSGEYGWGMQSPTSLRYAELSDGDISIMMEDGRRVRFDKTAPGVFTPPPGNEPSLSLAGSVYILTMKHGTKYYFENPTHRRVTKVVDTYGNTLTYTHDADGMPVTATDATTRTLGLTYNVNNQLTTLTGPGGDTSLFTYSPAFDLNTLTSPSGEISSYSFDASHRLTGITDNSSSETITISYASFSGFGEGVSSVTIGGKTWIFNYNSSTKVHTVTDPGGKVTTYQYDSYTDGRIVEVTDPAGGVVVHVWGADNKLSSTTDQNGVTTEFSYDGNKNVSAIKHAAGTANERINTFTYEPVFNRMTSVTGPTGKLTAYTRNANGRVSAATEASGTAAARTTTISHNAKGQITSITDPGGNSFSMTFDAYGNVASKTDALGKSATFVSDIRGLRISITDRKLNTTAYQYDGEGRPVKITNPDGGVTDLTYNTFGKVTTLTTPAGRTYTYSYTTVGGNQKLKAIKPPGGVSFTDYSYSDSGDLISYTDLELNVRNYLYTNNGKLKEETSPTGSVKSYQHDGSGKMVSSIDGNGNQTLYEYDELGRLVKLINPLGGISTFTYDQEDNLISSVDPNGIVTKNSYDVFNQLVSVIKDFGAGRLNSTTLYERDVLGNVTAITDENGNRSTNTYDGENRLLTTTNALLETTTRTYDFEGNLETVTYPNGNIVTYTVDALNRVTAVSDISGAVSSTVYDISGNIIEKRDGNGALTTISYDVQGRPVTVSDPLGSAVNLTYDDNSNVIDVTDKNGNFTTKVWDADNRPVGIHDAAGGVTLTVYDANGNVTRLTDEAGNNTDYQFNGLDLLTRVTYPNGSGESFTFDLAGTKISRTDAMAVTTAYSYDPLYNLTLRDYPGANDDSFTHDLGGRLTGAANSHATVSFSYDAVNRKISEVLNGKATLYEYDTPNGLKTITYPGGRVITETLDLRQRLASLKEGASAIASFSIDAGNRVTAVSYLNGTSSSVAYDLNDRITALSHGPGNFAAFTYGYDNTGNRLYEEKIHNLGSSEEYGFDNLHRLISYTKGTLTGGVIPAPSTQTLFNLDSVGNRLAATKDGAPVNYTSNTLNEYTLITGMTAPPSPGGVAVGPPASGGPGYDLRGNTTWDGQYIHLYDHENRLWATQGPSLPDVALYQYGPLGRRISKSSAAGSVSYYYRGSNVIEERDPSDVVLATYTYGEGPDNILSMNRGANVYYYHKNSLGSVVALTNALGAVAERYEYEHFGAPAIFDGAYAPLASSAISNPYMFTGRRFDPETGLYHYRARAYSPALGRFMQRDPKGYVDGMNLYEYVAGNPVNFTDPSGKVKNYNSSRSNTSLKAGPGGGGGTCDFVDSSGFQDAASDYLVDEINWDLFGMTFSRLSHDPGPGLQMMEVEDCDLEIENVPVVDTTGNNEWITIVAGGSGASGGNQLRISWPPPWGEPNPCPFPIPPGSPGPTFPCGPFPGDFEVLSVAPHEPVEGTVPHGVGEGPCWVCHEKVDFPSVAGQGDPVEGVEVMRRRAGTGRGDTVKGLEVMMQAIGMTSTTGFSAASTPVSIYTASKRGCFLCGFLGKGKCINEKCVKSLPCPKW